MAQFSDNKKRNQTIFINKMSKIREYMQVKKKTHGIIYIELYNKSQIWTWVFFKI